MSKLGPGSQTRRFKAFHGGCAHFAPALSHGIAGTLGQDFLFVRSMIRTFEADLERPYGLPGVSSKVSKEEPFVFAGPFWTGEYWGRLHSPSGAGT